MQRCAPIYNRASICLKVLICAAIVYSFAATSHAQPAHGIAMHGAPMHQPGFTRFSYVNPDAPKGGTVTFAALGSFDSLNPLIVMGVSAAGLRGYVFESLMARAYDEPLSLYGLLAESIDTPGDRSWVAFTLREQARFSDGTPVTVEDVLFSYRVLRDKGRPNHRTYYSKIIAAEKTGPRTIKFTFNAQRDREMPLIMGLMPILPRHYFSADTFETTTLKAPIGSGPYRIAKVEAG